MDNNLKTRCLVIKLILQDGVFSGLANNVKIIKDLTMNVNINKVSGLMPTTASVVIYGMLDSDINLLSRLQLFAGQTLPTNIIEIYAGYELCTDGFPPLAYKGLIWTAGVDKNDVDHPFRIYSLVYGLATNLIESTEVKGTIGLNELLQGMVTNYNAQASNDKLIYSPNNVVAVVQDQSYSGGSIIDLMTQACTPYDYIVQLSYPYILVYKKGDSPTKNEVIINKNNGMLGYPVPEDLGISCRIRYNPNIDWGYQVTVESSIQFTGINNEVITSWYINAMNTTLQNRGDKWESVLKLGVYNRGVV